jgi:hypothetical protein
MLVSHKHEFIFLRPRKAASTTVEAYFERFCLPKKALIDYQVKEGRSESITTAGIVTARLQPNRSVWHNHMAANLIRKHLTPRVWNEYHKFSIIRNPYTQILSWYYFYLGALNKHQTRKVTDNVDTERKWFEHWLTRNNNCLNFFVREESFISLRNNYCYNDIIRFEDLENEIKRVTDVLNLPFDASFIKNFKSNYKPSFTAAELYTKKSKQIVTNIAKHRLEHFGYTFPES